MVGYHGVSLRSCIQRQSAGSERSVHTGLASAPARCATDVQIVMTRSSEWMIADVSARSRMREDRSISCSPGGGCAAAAEASPFCREKKRTPATEPSGANKLSGIDLYGLRNPI